MPFTGLPTPEELQETIASLLDSARRCRRLADGITDHATCERLLELAKECDAKAEGLKKLMEERGTSG